TEALSRVMAELPGIGKDEHTDPRQGGYAYRGIEAITRAAQPLLAHYGIVLVPHVQSHEVVGVEVAGKSWTDTRLLVGYTIYGPGGPEDRIEVGPILAVGRDGADKGANKCMTQAFKYLLLQLLCVSDAKDDADAASVEADRHLPEDQRPWWELYGYTDEDEARALLDEVNELLRSVAAARREPVRRWLREHGYKPSTPVVVRASDLSGLEGVVRGALNEAGTKQAEGEASA
ncbi:MAG TPA: ERF family protein, partial [Acidimicrobiales bacterium]|nr:ERF family protein [Acidimicrobiales bacterium]